MPKNRRSTLAQGGSGSGTTVGENEMVDRVQDRLNEVGRVSVVVDSRTRRREETLDITFNQERPGIAQVHSASGNDYTVDFQNNTCDCMHYVSRENECRHIEATNRAIGQIMENREPQGITGSMSEEDIETTVSSRAQLDQLEEVQRREISREQEDDNFFYSDHSSQFRRNLLNLTEDDIEYEYENALNGSNVTFGVELEFVGGDANAIARELYDLGICAYSERVRYHAQGVEGKWKLERDGSVSSGSGGGEIVSPILKDTPETWRTIEKICEVAKRHGARIDQHCGGHVHLGMDQLDTARQRWRRFFKLIGGYEECIYRAAGGDEGRIRSNHSHYAIGFNDRASSAATAPMTLNTEDDVRRLAGRVGGSRYYGINLTNIEHGTRPTVEFRYFNGSLNPKQIQANIKLAAGIINASEKARTKDVESEGIIVSDSMKRRGNMLKDSLEHSRSKSNKRIMEFLDIVFTRKKDKDALINVFKKNEWR